MFWESFLILCSAKGITPSEVVRDLEIAIGSVTKWKNGSVPSQKNLVRIADYFGTTVGNLMGYTTQDSLYTEQEKNLLNLIKALTDDEVKQVTDYIDFVISKRGK